MADVNLYRVLILNFISSFVIALITADIFIAFGFNEGIYIALLFGLYFLVVYSLNNIIQARKIPNNHIRFITALLLIIIFEIAFMFAVSYLFGQDVIPPTAYLNLKSIGIDFVLVLSREFYLVLVAVIILIANIVIYRKEKLME